MAELNLATLQSAYNAAPASPQVLLSVGNPFGAQSVGFTEDGNNPIQQFRNNAGNVILATSFDGTRAVISSGLVETDIGLNTRASIRIRLDNIRLLPQDRTFSVAPNDIGRIDFNSTLTLNFVNATFRAFLGLAGFVLNQQSGNPFGNGLLFNHGNTYGNVNAVAANLGPIFTLVDQARFRADAAAIFMPQQNSVRVQPVFETINGGTLSCFTGSPHQSILLASTYNAGVTVGAAGREAIKINGAGGTGTMTGAETGLRIADFTLGAGIRRGLWVETNSPGRSLDLSGSGAIHLGNATATIGLNGAAPVVQGIIGGSRGGNVALANLLTYLALRGDIVDNTV